MYVEAATCFNVKPTTALMMQAHGKIGVRDQRFYQQQIAKPAPIQVYNLCELANITFPVRRYNCSIDKQINFVFLKRLFYTK
jgi:hypothetical protein